MTLIDEIQFVEKKQYTKEEILGAYQSLFNSDSLVAKIVLTDLINKTNYGTKHLPLDSNAMYHQHGMHSVIGFIREALNTPPLKEANGELQTNVNE